MDLYIARWQRRLSEDVGAAVENAYDQVGEHVMQATTKLRGHFGGQPKEILRNAADEVVIVAGEILGVPVEDMRCYQADVCFYIGDHAVGRTAARKRGLKVVKEFEKETPPDLVVEVADPAGRNTTRCRGSVRCGASPPIRVRDMPKSRSSTLGLRIGR